MKKITSAIALTLGLVLTGAPALAVDDPDAPSTNPQCQGATNRVCDWLYDWARLTKSLEETAAQQATTIQAQQVKIADQRQTIKHLRAKIRHLRH